MIRRIIAFLALMGVLSACAQSAQDPSALVQTPVRVPQAAHTSSSTPSSQPIAPIAVTAAPAGTTRPNGATVTGTVSYPADPALPPDAVLTIRLLSLSEGGVFGYPALSEQTIRPVGRGPTPFALAYDPAAIRPEWSYGVDAWISAPGRLDWRTEQPSAVLTQGHPATVDVQVVPPAAVASISGTVSYPAQAALPADAVLDIHLVSMEYRDAVGAMRISPVGPGPISFSLEYDPRTIDSQGEYTVYATLRAGEQIPFVTTTPYPVITRGQAATVDVVLQAPATTAATSGTITYRAQQPLPPDAKLVIQVKGHLGDDVPILVGEQVIAPVESGPIPFAIAVDPATIARRQIYQLDVVLYDGENAVPGAAAHRTVFAYVPTDVVLEPVQPLQH